MLYSYDDTLKIILRIYEYLQLRQKAQPRTLKMYDKKHRASVVSFMAKLPPSAGADFIWEFLLFQFYTYSRQDQELRPMPNWFMGDEAWRRWREYDEGMKWHAQQWAAEKKLENPVKAKTYKPVSEDTLRKERYRMSRISGPNFCGAKYGDSPYNPKDAMCVTCPFEKDCAVLYGEKDSEGRNLYQTLQDIPVEQEEMDYLLSNRVRTRATITVKPKYGNAEDE